MTNGACSGVRGAQTGLDNTTEALEYADATGCSLSHDAPTAVQESVLVAAGEDEQQATEGPRGESRQASDRNTAQSGWKNASQGVRIQMSIAKNFMNVIMTDRTGAKLLDADTGTSHERKIHEHACMLLKVGSAMRQESQSNAIFMRMHLSDSVLAYPFRSLGMSVTGSETIPSQRF